VHSSVRPDGQAEKSKTQRCRELATVCSDVQYWSRTFTRLDGFDHIAGDENRGFIDAKPHRGGGRSQPFLSEGFKFSMSGKQKSQSSASSAACSHDWTREHTAHFFHHNLNRKPHN